MYPPWFGLKHLKRASVMGKETAEVDHLKFTTQGRCVICTPESGVLTSLVD